MDNITNTINNNDIIKKIVIPRYHLRNDKSDIKLVYISIKHLDLINICTKLENNIKLDKKERDTANNIIPYFFKKIGDYENYIIRFIYKNIGSDINLFHLKNIIHDDLKRLNIIDDTYNEGYIFYSFYQKYHIHEFNNFINYITYSLESINGSEIINFLINKHILPYNLRKKTKTELLEHLNLIDNYNYISYELLTKQNLYNLFISLPYIYGPRNLVSSKFTLISKNTFKYDYFSYEGYNNDFFIDYENMKKQNIDFIPHAFNKYFKLNFNDKSYFNDDDKEREYESMNLNINSTNNTIYLYIVDDLKQKINNTEIYENFKSNLSNMIIKYNNNYVSENINYDGFTNNILNYDLFYEKYNSIKDYDNLEKHYINSEIIQIDKINYTSLIFDIYDLQLSYRLNLSIIFQDLITSNDIPIVYYVSGGEVKYYNIYKKLLNNINKNNISIFINIKKNDIVFKLNDEILSSHPNKKLRKLRYLRNMDYIKIKRMINPKEYINMYLFENGYIMGELDNRHKYTDIESIKHINLLMDIILKIKKYFKLTELPLPNPEKLIKFTSSDKIYNSIIRSSMIFDFKLSKKICYLHELLNSNTINDSLKISNYDLDKNRESKIYNYLKNNLDNYIINNKNLQPLVTNNKNEYVFIYKNKNYFYSENNIKWFLLKESTGKKITESFKDILFNNVSYLFNVPITYIRTLFSEIEDNITQTTKIDFNYLLCTINFNNKTISFKNLDNNNIHIKILRDLNIFFSKCLLNLNNNSEESETYLQTSKLKTLLTNIFTDDDMMDDLIDDDFDNALDKLIEFEKEEEKNINVKKEEKDYKNIIKKGSSISINYYMSQMREKYDNELYNPVVNGQVSEYKYGRSKCPNTKMRQPFIVSKEELKNIDPESITGYMEYRNNYYICPRIWDATINKPISVKKFIEAGLKSPYSGSKPVLLSKKKKYISDEYGVIVRKPMTDTQWEDKDKHPDWPELLKGTEKEAYPGLTYSADHPMKVCVPCCFINQPEDYDENEKGLQNFKKPFGYQKCNYISDKLSKEKLKTQNAVVNDETECKSEPYISNSSTILKNCRLGLLPNNLNSILNNQQHIFLNKNKNGLINGSGLFLRRGVIKNKNHGLLSTMTNILNLPSTSNLINLIHNKLSPLDFIALNNGQLIDVFCNATINLTGKNGDKLYEFIKSNPKLLTYLAFDSDKLINSLRENNLNKNIIILYNIYTGWKNYINYISNDNEIKKLEYIIDLFIKPREWLLKDGCNLIIFNKECDTLKCMDKINNKTKYVLMLIEEEYNYFIPISYIEYKYNKLLPAVNLIKIDPDINIPSNFKQIKDNDRITYLTKLLFIQNRLCNYNLTMFNKKLFKFIKSHNVNVNIQYIPITNKTGIIEFINLNNTIILPIYMHKYLYKTEINDNTSMHTFINNKDLTFNKYYDIQSLKHDKQDINIDIINYTYNTIFMTFNYIIDYVYIESINNTDYIIGIKFLNGLSISVKPEKINNKIETILNDENIKKINGKYPNILKKYIYNNLNIINLENSESKIYKIYNEINNLINIIKNQLSLFLIKENAKQSDIISKIKNDKLQLKHIKNLLDNIITKSNTDTTIFLNEILKQNFRFICNLKSSNKILCNNTSDSKYSKIKIPQELYNYILFKIYKDLQNNKVEAIDIFKGKYMYSNTINNDSIILTENELLFILSNNLVSKYIKNYKYKLTDNTVDVTISKEDIKILKDIVISDIDFTSIEMLTKSLTSIKEIKSRRQINTTVFNTQGFYNPKARAGTCKFPFRSNTGTINYKCIDARKIFNKTELTSKHLESKDQICPITVDKNKKTKTFGYCPEIKEQSIKRLNVDTFVDTYEKNDKTLKKTGTCSFPFLYYNKKIVNPLTGVKPLIKVSFKCEMGSINEGTWCYSKNREENNEYSNNKNINLFIGAKNRKFVYEGIWEMNDFIKDGKVDYKNIKNVYLKNNYKRGICTTKLDTQKQKFIENKLQLKNVKKITLNEYNPYYCFMSQSKKGYSKKELYIFGRDELEINYLSMLNKNYKILNKTYLCKLFNNKIRDIKKHKIKDDVSKKYKSLTDAPIESFYKLNPNNCLNGPKKGGYKLNELRDLLITYRGLNESKVYNMNKEDLCKIIKPDILDYKNISSQEIYPSNKNINYCEKPVNRGGIKKKNLNEIAMKLGIDILNKKKPELCKLIRSEINKIKLSQDNNNTKQDNELLTEEDKIKTFLLNDDDNNSTTANDILK